jgi:hypothetical protein
VLTLGGGFPAFKVCAGDDVQMFFQIFGSDRFRKRPWIWDLLGLYVGASEYGQE